MMNNYEAMVLIFLVRQTLLMWYLESLLKKLEELYTINSKVLICYKMKNQSSAFWELPTVYYDI